MPSFLSELSMVTPSPCHEPQMGYGLALILVIPLVHSIEGSHQPSVHTVTKLAAVVQPTRCDHFAEELERVVGQPQGRTSGARE
eukprot:556972-Prymnesium_polylepis.3